MPIPCYLLKTLPPGIAALGEAEPFRAALPQWRKLGLGPIVERVTGNGTLIDQGAAGTILVVWPEGQELPEPVPGVTAAGYVWHVIDDGLSIGWPADPQSPIPTADDLDNGNPLNVRTVPMVLADGNVWHVPEIREPSGSLLPTDLIRNRITGRLQTPLKREYQKLWEETEYWFDLFWDHLRGQRSTFNLERALEFASQVLALRYRFCDATQSALRILDSTNIQSVIATAIGWPAVLDRVAAISADDIDADSPAQKKSGPESFASVNGNSGPGDCGPSTDRPEVSNG